MTAHIGKESLALLVRIPAPRSTTEESLRNLQRRNGAEPLPVPPIHRLLVPQSSSRPGRVCRWPCSRGVMWLRGGQRAPRSARRTGPRFASLHAEAGHCVGYGL